MQTHNVGEESLCHRLGRVGVRQRDKMAVFAEAIHDSENDRLAADLGQCLNEIHSDIFPN